MLGFKKAQERYLQKLAALVAPVHGSSYPEFYGVPALLNRIRAKMEGETDRPALQKEFGQLRKLTQNHIPPGDVCPSYKGLYGILQGLGAAYPLKGGVESDP